MSAQAIDKLACWAVRYALGRMTYAVTDVTETLIAHHAALSRATRDAILRDIDEALTNGRAGAPMDALEWGRLRDVLTAGGQQP